MCAQLNACALLIPAGFCCGILDQLRTSAGPRALGAGGSGGRLLATASSVITGGTDTGAPRPGRPAPPAASSGSGCCSSSAPPPPTRCTRPCCKVSPPPGRTAHLLLARPGPALPHHPASHLHPHRLLPHQAPVLPAAGGSRQQVAPPETSHSADRQPKVRRVFLVDQQSANFCRSAISGNKSGRKLD